MNGIEEIDKKLLMLVIKDNEAFLEANPSATIEEYDRKRKRLGNVYDPILGMSLRNKTPL